MEKQSQEHSYSKENQKPQNTDARARKKLIKELIQQDFSPKSTCSRCEETNCIYQIQFRNLPNVIIAPIQYANTSLLKKIKPDVIFVDDATYNKFYFEETLTNL